MHFGIPDRRLTAVDASSDDLLFLISELSNGFLQSVRVWDGKLL